MKSLVNLCAIVFFTFFTLATTASYAAEAGDIQPLSEAEIKQQEDQAESKKILTMSPEMKAAMERRMTKTATNPNVVQVTDGLTTRERFVKYLHSGFIHIIPRGIDHILFVLGLFLSTIIFSRLVWQITTFTLAHSISLGLAASGIIQISANVVEPLIALSIAYIAFENIRNNQTASSRLIMIFVFGLLHGLGFAFVLTEFGLPSTSFLTSLFAFNIGVELGQLAVLVGAMVLFYRWSKKPSYRVFVQIPGSLLIGFVGLYWTIERVLNI